MYQKILVAIDGSTTSNRGLQEAIRLAHLTNGRIRLIHVIDELSLAITVESSGVYAAELRESLDKSGADIIESARNTVAAAGIDCDVVLHDNLSYPVHSLVNEEAKTWPADLIVLGTHGRRGMKRLWLGSSAEKILRSSPVPVLLVRAPEEEESPDAAQTAVRAA